jgi:hydrogenase expression/formation protein HypC
MAPGGDSPLRPGRVSMGGIVREVSLACVPEAQEGDYVLVHAGIALSRVDPDEAEKIFQFLAEIEELETSGKGAA